MYDYVLHKVTARTWTGNYLGYPNVTPRPLFCTLKCALAYAVRAAKNPKLSHCRFCGARLDAVDYGPIEE